MSVAGQNRIEGKNVLVTGASAGIGEACARKFATLGANLDLVARRGERLRDLADRLVKQFGVQAYTSELDVRDREAVGTFAADLEGSGRVPDILVNNAGLAAGLNRFYEGDFDDWDRMVDTNVKGLLNVSRCIVPMMVSRNRGHIVNIGSIAGHLVYPKGNVYNATKFAVRALSDAMNLDLVGTKVRVSCIDPGLVETEFSLVRFHGDAERARMTYKGLRALTADDVADAIAYVANAPEHVSVTDLVIMPTAQRSPSVIHREEKGLDTGGPGHKESK